MNGLGENIKDEVLTSVNALIQMHTDQEWKDQDESTVRHNHPKVPYRTGGGPKLEKPSTGSSILHPCLFQGGDIRKLGVKEKATMETETNQTKRKIDQTKGKLTTPIKHGKKQRR